MGRSAESTRWRRWRGTQVDAVKLALRRVKDPEVNLNIVDMG